MCMQGMDVGHLSLSHSSIVRSTYYFLLVGSCGGSKYVLNPIYTIHTINTIFNPTLTRGVGIFFI